MYFRINTPERPSIYGADIDFTPGHAQLTCEISGKKYHAQHEDLDVSFNDPEIWYKYTHIKNLFK